MGGGASSSRYEDMSALRESPIGRGLSDESLEAAVKLFTLVKCPAGKSVYETHKTGHSCLFVVSTGKLSMIPFASNQTTKLKVYKPGELIGATEVVSGETKSVTGKHSVNTVATVDSTLLMLTHTQFLKLKQDPKAAPLAVALEELSTERSINWCRQVPFFAPLGDEELKHIVSVASFVAPQCGEVLLTQDIADNGLYVVLRGKLQATVTLSDEKLNEMEQYRAEQEEKAARSAAGQQRRTRMSFHNKSNKLETHSLKAGDFVGEVTLLEAMSARERQRKTQVGKAPVKEGSGHVPSTATVTASKASLVLRFDSEAFVEAITLIDEHLEEADRIGPKIVEELKARSIANLVSTFHLAIFQGCSPSELQLVQECSKLVTFNPGDVVFRKGAPGDHFYIMCQGRVDITDPDKPDAGNLEECVTGEYFGELALTQRCARTATATAVEPSMLMQIPGDKFQEHFLNDPVVKAEFELKMLEKRVTVQAVLVHPDANPALGRFLATENALENIQFWNAVRDFRLLADSNEDLQQKLQQRLLQERADEILTEYILPAAPRVVNLPAKVRKAVEQALCDGAVTCTVFDRAQKNIELLIQNDLFPRFVQSENFKELIKAMGGYEKSITQRKKKPYERSRAVH